MNERSFRLLSRRQRLDEQLQRERARAAPDRIRLFRLQRLKLIIKDQLNRLIPQPLTPMAAR